MQVIMSKITIDPAGQKEWYDKKMEPLRYNYVLFPSDKVIDIGSYRREFADEIIRRYGCQVECFDALDDRAAWLYDGELMFGGAYLYTSIYEQPTVKYKCVNIVPFLQDNIALCKINIEGGEYQLLAHIVNSGAINNIANLQVQFHRIEGMDTDEAYWLLSERLVETHDLEWRVPFVWESWKRR
jgi:hypothetical protein